MQKVKKENDRYHTACKIFRILTDYFEDRVKMQKCYDIKNADFFNIMILYDLQDSCPYSQRPNTLSLTLSERSSDREIDDTPCQDQWGNRFRWTRMFTLRCEKGTWIPCSTKTSEGDDDGRDEGIFMKYAIVKEGTELRRRCGHWLQEKKRQTYTASLEWYRLEK